MIVNKINEYLAGLDKKLDEALLDSFETLSRFNFKRQFMTAEESKGGLRLSSCGKCARAQAYKMHNFPVNGKEMDSRSKVVFHMGDMTESMIVHLCLLAGCDVRDVGLEQKTVEVEVDGQMITGHPDGDFMPDAGNMMNLEIKSMSSFGFQKFERGDIDHTYLCQMHMYMKAKGQDKTIAVALNKDAGVLGEQMVIWNEMIYQDAVKRLTEAKNSTPECLPAPEFVPDAKGLYPWNCMYCANWKDCHPKAQRVLVGRSYKLKRG